MRCIDRYVAEIQAQGNFCLARAARSAIVPSTAPRPPDARSTLQTVVNGSALERSAAI
ncbi:MAG: hypothetical protein JNJ46_14450 [Myxococcales bacterium]|nr:hypothetical protein [Myxococcales bacterium]